jgi:hypothetical protein
VPDRCERLDAVSLDDLAWRSLGLPVDMAFFVRDAASGRMRAFYPSPAGATESQLELQTWEELEAANPALAGGAPEVEAVLVNRTGGRNEALAVPAQRAQEPAAVHVRRRLSRGVRARGHRPLRDRHGMPL